MQGARLDDDQRGQERPFAVPDWYLAEQRMTEVVLAPLQHSSHPPFISMPRHPVSQWRDIFCWRRASPAYAPVFVQRRAKKKKRKRNSGTYRVLCWCGTGLPPVGLTGLAPSIPSAAEAFAISLKVSIIKPDSPEMRCAALPPKRDVVVGCSGLPMPTPICTLCARPHVRATEYMTDHFPLSLLVCEFRGLVEIERPSDLRLIDWSVAAGKQHQVLVFFFIGSQAVCLKGVAQAPANGETVLQDQRAQTCSVSQRKERRQSMCTN